MEENSSHLHNPPMLLLIQGCLRQERESQRLLYQHYYGFSLGICNRYGRTTAEAQEMVNDGFLKVFQKIDQYKMDTSFDAWVRKIMINTAIDHYRKERKFAHSSSEELAYVEVDASVISQLSHEELIALVQQLSPAYRAVFNLYAIDGYSHEEIGKMLGISEGTSKSNLLKARVNLRKLLLQVNRVAYAKSV